MRPKTTEEQPTNAVLETKLDNLQRQMESNEAAEATFHTRMETKMDTLTALITTLETKVKVDRAEVDGENRSLKEKVKSHEEWHEREAQAAAERKESSQATGQILVGLLSAGVAIAALVVGSIFH